MMMTTKQLIDQLIFKQILSYDLFGSALNNSIYSEISRPHAKAISVVNAAHGAEILLKSIIADINPLLIFKKYPSEGLLTGAVDFNLLLNYGKTYQYSELPYILKAVTGINMEKKEEFLDFGQLRNSIMHFAVPSMDLSFQTLKFIFQVIDPLIWNVWNESFLEYSLDWNESGEMDLHLKDYLEQPPIFNLHPKTQNYLNKRWSGYNDY